MKRSSSDYQRIYSRRKSVTSILLVAVGVTSIRPAGTISKSVASIVGLPCGVRSVMISPSRSLHLGVHRHDLKQARWCVENLSVTVEDPTHVILDSGKRAFSLIRPIEELEKSLRVVIKHVPQVRARSGSDELWVKTIIPIGRKRLQSYIRNKETIEL